MLYRCRFLSFLGLDCCKATWVITNHKYIQTTTKKNSRWFPIYFGHINNLALQFMLKISGNSIFFIMNFLLNGGIIESIIIHWGNMPILISLNLLLLRNTNHMPFWHIFSGKHQKLDILFQTEGYIPLTFSACVHLFRQFLIFNQSCSPPPFHQMTITLSGGFNHFKDQIIGIQTFGLSLLNFSCLLTSFHSQRNSNIILTS